MGAIVFTRTDFAAKHASDHDIAMFDAMWPGGVAHIEDWCPLAQGLALLHPQGKRVLGSMVFAGILEWHSMDGWDLRGLDLRDADLLGADLRGADLRGVNLRRADLGGADLRGADLRGADLLSTNLGAADLRGANLEGCFFEPVWTNFKGARRDPADWCSRYWKIRDGRVC